MKAGDVLADVETDKATMELENYEPGYVLHLAVPEGGDVPVNGLITIIGKKGENIDHLLNQINNEEPIEESKDEAFFHGFVGEVKMYAGEELPNDWLRCDGAAFEIDKLVDLFSVIGHQYGGEGNVFQIPKISDVNGVSYIICKCGLFMPKNLP